MRRCRYLDICWKPYVAVALDSLTVRARLGIHPHGSSVFLTRIHRTHAQVTIVHGEAKETCHADKVGHDRRHAPQSEKIIVTLSHYEDELYSLRTNFTRLDVGGLPRYIQKRSECAEKTGVV